MVLVPLGAVGGALTADELVLERQARDEALVALDVALKDADQRIGQVGVEELELKVELVVSCLSQPGFHMGDPELSLSALFPNRLANAQQTWRTKRLTVAEFQKMAIGRPAVDDGEAGRQFLKVVQTLVKRVMIGLDGRIEEFVLWIAPPPPDGPDGDASENHT